MLGGYKGVARLTTSPRVAGPLVIRIPLAGEKAEHNGFWA